MKKANKEMLANMKQLRELFPMLNDAGQEILMMTAATLNKPAYLKTAAEIKVTQKTDHERPPIVALEGTAPPAPAETDRWKFEWKTKMDFPRKLALKSRDKVTGMDSLKIYDVNLDKCLEDWLKNYRHAS